MIEAQPFQPDWASPPCDSIVRAAKERRITLPQLGQHLELDDQELEQLIGGDTAINVGLARKLAITLGASVEFWMSRDFDYRRRNVQLRSLETEWLAKLPIDDMIKFGWLRPAPKPTEELEACLRYFGVLSVSAWMRKYEGEIGQVAFRTSPTYQSNSCAVAAWLRQGDLQATQLDCAPWDPESLQAKIPEIRQLTRQKNPQKFLPDLQAQCAEAGVAVTVVRSPSGCRASGAVRFVNPTKAIIQLSFRYLSDDHFWFTLFHEIGHLVLHDVRKRILLEQPEIDQDSDEERQANAYAAKILISKDDRLVLARMSLNSKSIIRFARKLGVSPGIVVGQLQHEGRLRHNQLNRLKRRFVWTD